jgi:hypothetical protein
VPEDLAGVIVTKNNCVDYYKQLRQAIKGTG